MIAYDAFLAGKIRTAPATGIADVPAIHLSLFPFQRDLTAWAIRRGRAAIFADTGLGKMRMEIEWARVVATHTGRPVLILCPLGVRKQIADEGATIGVDVTVCQDSVDVRSGVNVTNYDRLARFTDVRFDGLVLDESSIIKHHDSKTLAALLDFAQTIPFRLAGTATPAPNDHTELGTHAEFLGICTRTEMLSEFFCHDGGETQTWRLKGHARTAFYRWLATWGAMVRLPSDLGYPDDGYVLPPMRIDQHIVDADAETVRCAGTLFAVAAETLMDQARSRRASVAARVTACADIVTHEPDEPWIVWCDLNDESGALVNAIPGAVEVRGADTTETKERAIDDFRAGRIRVLVSKPSIFGFGVNLQQCARVAFVGVTHSWEAYYQAVRRCWRFGQRREVRVHLFASEIEGNVTANLARKEADARQLADALSAETRDAVRANVRGATRESIAYAPSLGVRIPDWLTSEAENAG